MRAAERRRVAIPRGRGLQVRWAARRLAAVLDAPLVQTLPAFHLEVVVAPGRSSAGEGR